MARKLVQSPENAVFEVEQDLHDAGDKSACYRATVHVVEGKVVCNTWARSFGRWKRLMPERVLPEESEANPGLLIGEAVRTAEKYREKAKRDSRVCLGIFGMHYAALEQTKKYIKSQKPQHAVD